MHNWQVVSSWDGQLNWGPGRPENHIDTCRGCVENHGTPPCDIALSHLMGALNTFSNLFIAPHYMRDNALGLAMLPADLAIYIGFGNWSKAQRRFISSLKLGRGSTIFRALIWSSLQTYFSSGDPWDHYLCPRATLEHHIIICIGIKGPSPCPLFMKPSPSLWHLEYSFWPSNDPFTTWFHHFNSLMDGFFITLWATWWACYQGHVICTLFMIVGDIKLIGISRRIM